MLIVGSRSVAPPPPPEIILEDAFTGETLDTDKWTAATLGDDSTVTQNDELILTGTVGAAGHARVISDVAIPTSGLVTIEVDWTPGKKYSSGANPYIAIVPTSPTRDATYGFPYTSGASDACVTMMLGARTDTTSRTSIGCGLLDYILGSVIGYVAYATELNCAENSTYALKLEINWDTKSLSFWLDGGDPKISNVTFAYPDATFSGDHFIELAYCDYGAASNPVEKFDNLVITAE